MAMQESAGEESRSDVETLTRLRVVAEADPGALARVLARFQNLNLTPRRVVAEFGSPDKLYIQVDLFGLGQKHIALIADKVRQDVCVLSAHWHRV